MLFGFDSLMEAIRISTSVHDTSGLLVYDEHLIVHDHVLIILLEEGIGFEQLIDSMYTLALDRIVGYDLILGFATFFCIGFHIVQSG